MLSLEHIAALLVEEATGAMDDDALLQALDGLREEGQDSLAMLAKERRAVLLRNVRFAWAMDRLVGEARKSFQRAYGAETSACAALLASLLEGATDLEEEARAAVARVAALQQGVIEDARSRSGRPLARLREKIRKSNLSEATSSPAPEDEAINRFTLLELD